MSRDRGTLPSFQIQILAGLVGELIEGTTAEKTEARATLKKLIGRGRCILNAADQMKRENSEFAEILTRRQKEGAQ